MRHKTFSLLAALMAGSVLAGHEPPKGPPPHVLSPIPGGEAALHAATPGGARPGVGARFSMQDATMGADAAEAVPDMGMFPNRPLPNAATGAAQPIITPEAAVTVVVLYDQKCPCTARVAKGIEALARSLEQRGGRLVAVDPGVNNSAREQQAHARTLVFPLLRDPSGMLAIDLGLDTTPAAVVVDREGRIRYVGAFDSGAYTPKMDYARLAAEAVLGERPVPFPRTRVDGCSVNFSREAREELERRDAAARAEAAKAS